MRAVVLASIIVASTCAVHAQEKKLTLVVGFSAGGTSSISARIIAESIKKMSGIDVLVENRPGAGGLLAASWVKQQKGAGTLLFMSATSSLRVPPSIGLVPVCLIATYPYVAVVKDGTPGELAAYMTAAKNDFALQNVATAGAGSIPHLVGERMFASFGVPMVHVPYTGSAQAIQDVYGSHVSMAIVPLPDFVPFKGQMRVVAETGRGIETGGWMGVFAPPGTSRDDVESLARLFQAALADTDVRGRLETFGFQPRWRSAAALRALHEGDNELLMPIAKKLKVTP